MGVSKKEILSQLWAQKELFSTLQINIGDLADQFALNLNNVKAAIKENAEANQAYMKKITAQHDELKSKLKQGFSRIEDQLGGIQSAVGGVKGDTEELLAMMKLLMDPAQPPAPAKPTPAPAPRLEFKEECVAMFKKIDTDHDGFVDEEELIAGLMGEPYNMRMVGALMCVCVCVCAWFALPLTSRWCDFRMKCPSCLALWTRMGTACLSWTSSATGRFETTPLPFCTCAARDRALSRSPITPAATSRRRRCERLRSFLRRSWQWRRRGGQPS